MPFAMSAALSRKLDVARIVLVALIVWLHADTSVLRFRDQTRLLPSTGTVALFQHVISQGIGRVAVPLFFAMAGYLFFLGLEPTPLGFRRKITRRLRSLAPVYLFWSGIWLVPFFVLSRTTFGGLAFHRPFLEQSSLQVLLYRWLVDPVPSQLWFLRSLMLLVCVSPLIYAAVRRWGAWPLAMVAAVWLMPYDVPVVQTRSILFFGLGAYLAVHHPDALERRVRLAAWLAIPWVALVILKVLIEARAGRSLDQALTVTVLLGVPAVWFLIDALPERWMERLRWAGRYSFFVSLAHEPIQGGVLKVSTRVLGPDQWVDAVVFMGAPTVVMTALLATAVLLERVHPSALAFLTGGRGARIRRMVPESGAGRAVPDRPGAATLECDPRLPSGDLSQ